MQIGNAVESQRVARLASYFLRDIVAAAAPTDETLREIIDLVAQLRRSSPDSKRSIGREVADENSCLNVAEFIGEYRTLGAARCSSL